MGSAEAIKEMKIFANPIRLKILQTIASAGSISFTELRDETATTDGSLYYHLKMLKEFIEKDQQNFYRLNSSGKAIVNRLVHNVEPEENAGASKPSTEYLNVLGLGHVHYYLLGDRARTLVELHALLFVVAWLFGVTNSHFSAIETIFTGGAIVNAIVSVAHWYIYLIIVYAILRMFKRTPSFIEIWIVVFVGMLPYLLYLLPAGFLYYFDIPINLAVSILLNILFVLCKLWSTLVVAKGISITSQISELQGFLTASLLIFIDYIYLLIVI